MKIEVSIPSPGESIEQLEITQWLVGDGQMVEKDQELAVLESEKASLSLVAQAAGKVKILVQAPSMVKVGSIACIIDADVVAEMPLTKKQDAANKKPTKTAIHSEAAKLKVSPLAKKLANINEINIESITPQGSRLTKSDVEKAITRKKLDEREERVPMTQLRKKLSEKLVSVQLNTAMLTTFNEFDLLPLLELRKQYGERFMKQFGVKLGLMSFFTKAAALALNEYRNVNASINGTDMVFYRYVDIGIAVQTEKGLMVPVLRDVHEMTLPEIEQQIYSIAEKARQAKISLNELTGGTFTITNGGVFGSLLSTPLINPPQSAILGMHTIQERPVARNSQVVIRPMMYVALSYDHRIIDGRDSVGFLKTVKNYIENPMQLYNFDDIGR